MLSEGCKDPSEQLIVEVIGRCIDIIPAMTINVSGLLNKKANLCTVLDRSKLIIVAIQETLLTRVEHGLFLPGYTSIESKMIDQEGSPDLALAVRKGSGLELSEFEAVDLLQALLKV